MRREVRQNLTLPQLRRLGLNLVRPIPPKDWYGEINAIFQFVQHRIRYTLDPHTAELVQSPHVTLQIGTGDCDDMCTLLACLLSIMGHACTFCAVGFGLPRQYTHVFVLCDPAAEGREMIALDATENYPMGWEPPGITCAMIAPIFEDLPGMRA